MSKAKANLTEFKDRHYALGSHRNKELRGRQRMNNNLTGLARYWETHSSTRL